jgi:hypothetical protein
MNSLRRISIAAALLLAFPAAAQAGERIAAVTATGTLLTFDNADPTDVLEVPITGLEPGVTLRGIDYRPATDQVFAIAAPSGQATAQAASTYIIDVDTGVARLAAISTATIPLFGDVVTAYDFNPNVDRIRVMNVNDENFRLNPNNGALAADDPNVGPATADLVEVAYDRNAHTAGSVATTLFAINRASSALSLVGGVNGTPSPNGGAVSDVGSLGTTLDADKGAGFDISVTGVAHAALTSGGVTRYHQVNLATGSAGVGVAIGDGTDEVVGLTRVPDSSQALYAEIAQDVYRRSAGEVLRVKVASTLPGVATLTLSRGGDAVRSVTRTLPAGTTSIRFGKVPTRRGGYTLGLSVRNAKRTATDTARVRVTR